MFGGVLVGLWGAAHVPVKPTVWRVCPTQICINSSPRRRLHLCVLPAERNQQRFCFQNKFILKCSWISPSKQVCHYQSGEHRTILNEDLHPTKILHWNWHCDWTQEGFQLLGIFMFIETQTLLCGKIFQDFNTPAASFTCPQPSNYFNGFLFINQVNAAVKSTQG